MNDWSCELWELSKRRLDYARCSVCGEEYKICDLFCLNSLRGANSGCVKVGCVLLCGRCLSNFKKCSSGMEVE